MPEERQFIKYRAVGGPADGYELELAEGCNTLDIMAGEERAATYYVEDGRLLFYDYAENFDWFAQGNCT